MESGVHARGSHAITVLFVDDDADTRFAYQLVASEAETLVHLARDGQEAISLAQAVRPDVIVLDLGLRSGDGVDGLEVVRRLRASDRTCGIPIIIASGSASARDEADVEASGCEGRLVKPCSADGLIDLVSAVAIQGREAAANGAVRRVAPA